jgi:hypothetical protein
MGFCPTTGRSAAQKLCEAMGIKGSVRRLVIDFQVNDVAMVYVQRFLDKAEIEPLEKVLSAADFRTEYVEHLAVDEKGNVSCHKAA